MSLSQLKSTLAHEEEKLLACIHCGLCLEACPTYVVTADENDGPRGRLYLMRAVGEGRLANTSTAFERHIDRCLGCRACEQVCPAGVEYGQLLEAARGELFNNGAPRGFGYGMLRLMLRHVWPYPARLKILFAFARVLRNSGLAGVLRTSGIAHLISTRFEFALALLESSKPKLQPVSGKSLVASPAQKKGNSFLFNGCVGAGLFSRINEATERVLRVNGFQVTAPAKQVCCGALHAHAGDLEGARQLARQNIAAFNTGNEDGVSVITNAGGCGAMLASYGHLLRDDEEFAGRAQNFSARVRDISQQLETLEINQAASAANKTVTYDASCHLLYGQHAGEAPLKMIGAITDLAFERLEGSERCCGGAGIYNLLEPDLSSRVLAEKLANVKATSASILATGNAGCQMQIGAGALLAGMNLTTCHPVELLDQAYAQAGLYKNQVMSDE